MVALFGGFAQAEPPQGWTFVWVTAGETWSIVEGTATVSLSRGTLVVDMIGANTVKYSLRGSVQKDGSIRAKFTNLESDFFVDSPMTGRHRKIHYRDVDPCGKELFYLHDGFNFLGVKREIRPPECKP